jgi:hypothetical protein
MYYAFTLFANWRAHVAGFLIWLSSSWLRGFVASWYWNLYFFTGTDPARAEAWERGAQIYRGSHEELTVSTLRGHH